MSNTSSSLISSIGSANAASAEGADSDCSNNLCCSIGTAFECDCSDGLDNDGNGQTDCAETVCSFDASCASGGGGQSGSGNENCDDILDNDADGFNNCDDSDCAFYPTCYESSCDDGLDQDGDGDIDCADSDCAFLCLEKNCADSTDDDHDGLMDCADSDCTASTKCAETDCFDGVDNDGDGNTDCTDSECYVEAACQVYSFDGTYTMDVTLSDANASTDDCIGTLSVTATTDGYNHADISGTGSCTSTTLGTIDLSLDGFAFQNSGTTSTFGGLVTHVNSSNETFYGNIANGNLVFDPSTATNTIQLTWQTSLPITGVLLPTNGVATY